ncbi:MAG: hypothetical protein M3065_20335 [Actinomycetota bacterium]|nr:hypothetical protein [Actinomycetota bacterium]
MEIASITTSLTPLAILACPVGMGAMMWLMMRGHKREQGPARDAPPHRPPDSASLELLREEHNRLSDEIDRLERRQIDNAETITPR